MSRAWAIALGAAALLSLAADFVLPGKEAAHFWETKTFFAWFGLAGCVAIVLISKWLGKHLLQRPEGYWSGAGAPGDGEGRDAG